MRERERERRVINEMRRRTTDEVVSLEDETLVGKFRLMWPVLVIVLKSRLNAFFEIITKAGLTSVRSMFRS